MSQSALSIAVIGIGCNYPDAQNLTKLWENVLSRRCQFRQLPAQRLPLWEYYDPDKTVPDKTYGKKAAVIDGFQFDWASRRIPQKTVLATDIVHWLALETADQAIKDAGYTRATIPQEKTGVILGNTLTGEQTRAGTMRLRWPYVKKALLAAGQHRGLSEAEMTALVTTTEKFYKSVFAPVTEDSLAGGLSNTIAGRVCNYFNLDGGGYTVDGACASSLIAVANACSALMSGDLDIALAGGVDVSLDTMELIGFAKTGALTNADMKVYDRRASGFIPGEGCGFVVLKRYEDAEAAGDYIYATIKGWGISADGKGGITAPSRFGQSKALLRAYQKAGYQGKDIDFIEGHGTGTPVGDREELEGIAIAINHILPTQPRRVGVTSFKSLFGHTKAAAGIGGLIKTILAVNQKVIPPIAGCQEPNPVFADSVSCAYPILTGEVCEPKRILRAGVSAMGFGGINTHIALESANSPKKDLKIALSPRELLVSAQDSELFVFSASSIEQLLERTYEVINLAQGISIAEMADLAVFLTKMDLTGYVKAAVIASDPEQLINNLQQLEQILQDSPPVAGEVKTNPYEQIWVGNQVTQNRVAFLFPGQGSQRLNTARTIVERFTWAQQLVKQADQWLQEIGCQPVSQLIYRCREKAADEQELQQWLTQLSASAIAYPAICLASLLWIEYLKRLGIEPKAVGGHSLGELTAFYMAGAYDAKTLIQFAALRGQALANCKSKSGTMASLGCDRQTAEKIIAQVPGYLVVANLNSTNQTVISGDSDSINHALQVAAQHNVQTRKLPVANAFHSQLVAEAAEYIKVNAPVAEDFISDSLSVFSSTNGKIINSKIKLKEHFGKQITSPVNFVELVKEIDKQVDLFLEVGSGKVLCGLGKEIIKQQSKVFSTEAKSDLKVNFHIFLARFFISNGKINWQELYSNRLIRDFIATKEKVFIENPCERQFQVSPEEIEDINKIMPFKNEARNYKQPKEINNNSDEVAEILTTYFQNRSDFLAELIKADLENLPYFFNNESKFD
ncbi:beta ketoacyl-acyl carrier protein synthase [Chondrocystis sp. NIES-4102]|nr:beta ketoacyl-acyl carrier protein synthase [Chondrocystis sp. NIES-4102]